MVSNMMRELVFVFLASALSLVQAEGYPKETPGTPFNTGSAGGGDTPVAGGDSRYPPVSMDYDSRYRGPVAMLMVLPDGHIADTAEVTAARAAHLAALDKAKVLWAQVGAGSGSDGMGNKDSSAGGNNGYDYPQPVSNSIDDGVNSAQSYLPPQSGSTGTNGQGTGVSSDSTGNMPYNGPLAMLMVLPDGHLADTAEVTAARAAHLTALEKAKALWSQAGINMGHGGSSSGGVAGGNSGYNYPQPGSNSGADGSSQSYLPPGPGSATSSSQSQKGLSSQSTASVVNVPYNGPLAMLMVLPSGYLADTPDIAALRAAHLSALLKAQAAWKPQTGMQH